MFNQSLNFDFHSFSQEHLNVRAALIHVLGDLIQSVGVLISSVLIKIDPGLKGGSNSIGVFWHEKWSQFRPQNWPEVPFEKDTCT